MIPEESLRGLAFAWALVTPAGVVLSSADGAIFPAPVYSTAQSAQIALQAIHLKDGGWATCGNGYAIHRFTSDIIEPNFIVLHGLKVTGVSTAQGRSEGLSIRLNSEDILRYVHGFVAGLESLDDHYRSLIRQNIHEVRGINSALYNTALGLQTSIDYGQYNPSWPSVAKSVVSLSEILRGRIDFMEFIANPTAQQVAKGEIAVYRKFDKLQRCFRVTAQQRKINLEMTGSSVKTVYGPPIFDLVPYLLLDNALKYSPDGFPISIVCNDSERSIYCSVSSQGPRIEEDEIGEIFAPGVRGRNALKSRLSGSGLGLSVLKKVVDEVFRGTITITQAPSDTVSINGVPYCLVTFDIKLPLRGSRHDEVV